MNTSCVRSIAMKRDSLKKQHMHVTTLQAIGHRDTITQHQGHSLHVYAVRTAHVRMLV
jgi:hypothetical protein